MDADPRKPKRAVKILLAPLILLNKGLDKLLSKALGDSYYDKERLWKLIGNVDIQNRKGERFNTELLYWNEATQKVYSDKFIRIQQPDRIITGHGFDSNQQMTVYTIHNIEGIFYVDDEATAPPQPETKALPDSVKKDSVK